MRILSLLITLLSLIAALVVAFLLFGGDPSLTRQAKRARLAATATARDPIQVAVVWPWINEEENFLRGIKLAAEEINHAGGLLGRRVELKIYKESEKVAEHIVKDPRTIAVIGYAPFGPVLRHAITYNKEKVVYIMPFATNPHYTLQDFLYSFRTITNDEVFAEWLTKQMLTHAVDIAGTSAGEINVVVLAGNDGYGRRFANTFQEMAGRWKGRQVVGGVTNIATLRIIETETYPLETTNFFPLIEEIKKHKMDVLLVADELPRAGHLIRQLRELGIYKPIVGSPALDSPWLWNIASNRAFGVYFPSTFVWPLAGEVVPETLLVHSLVKLYAKAHGTLPDLAAAQGYEALHLLGQAITRSASTVPQSVASVLEHADNWRGLLEVYKEFENDELVTTKLFLKFLVSEDYPPGFRDMRPFVQRDITVHPYTYQVRFSGVLLSVDTNRIVPMRERQKPAASPF